MVRNSVASYVLNGDSTVQHQSTLFGYESSLSSMLRSSYPRLSSFLPKTHSFSPALQFDYWRESRCDSIHPPDADIQPDIKKLAEHILIVRSHSLKLLKHIISQQNGYSSDVQLYLFLLTQSLNERLPRALYEAYFHLTTRGTKTSNKDKFFKQDPYTDLLACGKISHQSYAYKTAAPTYP